MGCFDVDGKVLLQETSGIGGIHGFCQEPPELLLAIGAWPPALVLMELHRITEYLSWKTPLISLGPTVNPNLFILMEFQLEIPTRVHQLSTSDANFSGAGLKSCIYK